MTPPITLCFTLSFFTLHPLVFVMTDITHDTTNNSDNTNKTATLPVPVLPVPATENIAAKPHTSWLTRGALLILFLCNLATAAGGVWLWRQLDMAGRTQIVQQEAL